MIDWPWWIMFAAAMVSSYFREMRLRTERNDPRCTLFYTYNPNHSVVSVVVLCVCCPASARWHMLKEAVLLEQMLKGHLKGVL